jgi:Uma2 family endonuclease
MAGREMATSVRHRGQPATPLAGRAPTLAHKKPRRPCAPARDDGIVVVNMENTLMAPAPILTTDEYLRTPETLRPTELVFGRLRAADAPSVRHQQAVGAFYLHLMEHVRQRRLGNVLLSPLDVVLDYDRALILQPDLLFVSHARATIVRDRIMGAPDMVLEVLSPQPRIGQLQERVDWFASYGVREIWLLHHLTERFEIVRVQDGRVNGRESFDYYTALRSDVLPDFTAPIGDIVRDS